MSGTLLAVLGLVAMRLASLQLLPWVFLASLLFQQLAEPRMSHGPWGRGAVGLWGGGLQRLTVCGF